MPKILNSDYAFAYPANIVAGEDDQLVEVVLCPPGDVRSSKGDFVCDYESFELVRKAFEDRANEIVIDYEHQTLGGEFAREDGKAPAAGWVKDLKFDTTRGLIGMVEWTVAARESIRSGEYKYLSPVIYTRKDGRVVELHSAAVTNNPAIKGMQRLAAKRGSVMKRDIAKLAGASLLVGEAAIGKLIALTDDSVNSVMDAMEEIGNLVASLRGLLLKDGSITATAGPVEVLTAAAKKYAVQELSPLKALVCKSLGVGDSTADKEIVGKIDELLVRVPASDYKVLKDRLDTIEADVKKKQSSAYVEELVDSGYLNPNDKDRIAWAMKRAESDLGSFRSFMDGAPKLYEPGSVQPKNGKVAHDHRSRIILSAKGEFLTNRDRLTGVTVSAFVNGSLATENLAMLSVAERTALEKE